MELLIPHVTPRPTSSNITTPPDEDSCHEMEDLLQNSSSSTAIETPDNTSSQEAANDIEICEDRSTGRAILPISEKPGVPKKCRKDTADEIDVFPIRTKATERTSIFTK